jgi:oxygen-dependent protoporphyrinogen oxidase
VKRIAILGGGISGLSAAVVLEDACRRGAPLRYSLLEASSRLGGVLRTEQVEGCIVEAGPDSFLTEKHWAADFCRRLGLGEQLIFSQDAQRKTHIVVRGRLLPLPEGLQFLVPTRILPIVFSPLFSWTTKLRIAGEYFRRPVSASGFKKEDDESVADFIGRHFGTEVVERLADPLLAGVYGGEAAGLSTAAVLPRLWDLEKRFGSLSRGFLQLRRQAAAARKAPAPIFTSVRDGMQQLAQAAIARLQPSSIRLSDPARALEHAPDGWRIIARGSATETFDAVIVATPAHAAAGILEMVDTELASELRRIPYTSSMTVALGFDRAALATAPPGFGFLVPRAEGSRLLACTFVHAKFPHRVPPELGLLRCFLGGSRDPAALHMSDADVLKAVLHDLRRWTGLAAEPRFVRIYRWPRAMAQYAPGHRGLIDRIEGLRAEHPGLELAGNAYQGIGVPDCIASGTRAAQNVLAYLGLDLASASGPGPFAAG